MPLAKATEVPRSSGSTMVLVPGIAVAQVDAELDIVPDETCQPGDARDRALDVVVVGQLGSAVGADDLVADVELDAQLGGGNGGLHLFQIPRHGGLDGRLHVELVIGHDETANQRHGRRHADLEPHMGRNFPGALELVEQRIGFDGLVTVAELAHVHIPRRKARFDPVERPLHRVLEARQLHLRQLLLELLAAVETGLLPANPISPLAGFPIGNSRTGTPSGFPRQW